VRAPSVGIVLIVFFLLQVSVADSITFARIGPDFPLLIAVYFAIFRGALAGSLFGFAVGLLQDFFNPSGLGLNALAKSIVGHLAGRMGAQTDRDNPLFLMAVFGAASLAHDFIYLLFFTQFNLGKFIIEWLAVGVPSAIYTAVAGGVVHALVAVLLSEAVRHLGKTRSF